MAPPSVHMTGAAWRITGTRLHLLLYSTASLQNTRRHGLMTQSLTSLSIH